jgi:hypothetical protein
MAGPLFNQNYPHLTDQAVAKGKPISNGTLGPFVSVGPSQTNPWMSDYAKQPDAQSFPQQQFSDDSATQSLNLIKSFGADPKWTDPNVQNWSSIFLSKYTIDNGLIPADQKVSQASLAGIQSQQPAQMNPPGTLAAGRMNYPGSSGVQVG